MERQTKGRRVGRAWWCGFLGVLLVLAVTGCGGGGGSEPSAQTAAPVSTGRISGKVKLGNLPDNRGYVTGVRVTARELGEAARRGARTAAYETTTDSSGRYTLDLPAGEYLVEAQGGVTRKAAARVTVDAAATTTVDFVLTATGSIRGQLAISGVHDVYVPGTGYFARTDVEGRFEIADVPVGTYELRFPDGGTFVTVGPGVNDLGVLDPAAMPPMVHVDWDPGRVISPRELAQASLVLWFSVPMDRGSVESALSTDPATDRLVLEWLSDTALALRNLDGAFGPGDVAVRLAESAAAQSGLTLASPFEYTFTVAERLLSHWPYDGESVYPSDQGGFAWFAFSAPMDRASVQVSVDPEVPGLTLTWESERAVRIVGEPRLGTTYTVTLASARTEAGEAIHGLPVSLSFQTVEPRVENFSPIRGALDVPTEGSPVTLRFNTPVDRDSVEAGLRVTRADGSPVEGIEVRWISEPWGAGVDTATVTFPMAYGTTYSVALEGANALSGEPIAAFQTSFTTLSPRLVDSAPAAGGVTEPHSPIVLNFNVPADLSAASFTLVDDQNRQVAVEPAAQGGGGAYYGWHADDPYLQYEPWECENCHGYDLHGFGYERSECENCHEGWHGGDPNRQYAPWECQSCHSGGIPDSEGGAETVGAEVRTVILEPEGLPAGREYTLAWTGLRTPGGTPMPDGTLVFRTEPKGVAWTEPAQGAVDVPLQHRVRLAFNDVLTADERVAVEEALRVEGARVSGVDETHPEPLIVWDDGETTDALIVNFTFDPGVNYRVYLQADEAGWVRTADGTPVLRAGQPLQFTTVPPPEVPDPGTPGEEGPVDLVREVRIAGAVALPEGVTVEMLFGTPVWFPWDSVEEFVTLTDADGNPVDLSGASFGRGSLPGDPGTWYHDGREYSKLWTVYLPPLRPGTEYVLNVNAVGDEYTLDRCGVVYGFDSWECQGVVSAENLVPNVPAELRFETESPRIALWLDEWASRIEVTAQGNAWFSTDELLSAFSTVPGATGEWDFEALDPVPEYVQTAIFVYRPTKYASLRVDVGELTAYEESGGTFVPLGPFGNVPLSEVFGVSPDLEAPRLQGAVAEALDRVRLTFSTRMDAELASDPANYRITDAAGQELQVLGVEEPARGYFYEPGEIVLLTAPQNLGETYTVAVSNLASWGGNFSVAADASEATFSAYRGRVTGVEGVKACYGTWDESAGTDTWVCEFVAAVSFDVPVDPATATPERLGLWGEGDIGGTWEPGRVWEETQTTWSEDRKTAVVSAEVPVPGPWWWRNVAYLWLQPGLGNAGGALIDLTGYQGIVWVPWNDPGGFSLGGAPFHPSAPTLELAFPQPMDQTLAEDPSRYEVTVSSGYGGPYELGPAVTAATRDPDDPTRVTLSLSAPLVAGDWEWRYVRVRVAGVAPEGSPFAEAGVYPLMQTEGSFFNDPSCSRDSDGDGVADCDDAFPDDPTAWLDSDLDGVADGVDNCPFDWNPDQLDSDADGIGDACLWCADDTDGDGVGDCVDPDPWDPAIF